LNSSLFPNDFTALDALTVIQLLIGNSNLPPKHQYILDKAVTVLDEIVQRQLDTYLLNASLKLD